jgi:hypothetical protein
MMEQGIDSSDYKRFMSEGSNNVADDGNYSIQVFTYFLIYIYNYFYNKGHS